MSQPPSSTIYTTIALHPATPQYQNVITKNPTSHWLIHCILAYQTYKADSPVTRL